MPDVDEHVAIRTSRWRPVRRSLRRLLLWAASLYLIVILVIFAIQDRLIFAGHAYQGLPQSRVEPSSDFELLHLKTADGTTIVAIFGTALDAHDRPLSSPAAAATVIYFYGNAMSVADSFAEFHRLRRLGCNVLIPDFVGYGMSGGQPSEKGCYATADAAYNCLLHRDDVDSKRIVAAGWSLGVAVAIDLASREPVAGLIGISGFSSMRDVAREVFPWALTSLLLRSKFESERKIESVNAPILLIHGENDSIIPFVMRDRLATAARAAGRTVDTLTIKSDHVDVFEVGGDEMDAAIGGLIRRACLRESR